MLSLPTPLLMELPLVCCLLVTVTSQSKSSMRRNRYCCCLFVFVAVPILSVALATVALRRLCKATAAAAALRVISEATNRGSNKNNNNSNNKSCNAATAEEVAKKFDFFILYFCRICIENSYAVSCEWHSLHLHTHTRIRIHWHSEVNSFLLTWRFFIYSILSPGFTLYFGSVFTVICCTFV